MKLPLGCFLLLGWVMVAGAVPGKPSPRKTPIVFTQVAEHKKVFDRLTYPARVVPVINAAVLSEGAGVVQKVLAPLGASVKKGEKLLTILNTDPVYNYAPAAVRAPVSGVVSRVEVTEGTRVTKGQRLLNLTDPKSVRIELEVAVSDLKAIRAGMVGTMHLNQQAEPLNVKVLGISPYVDPGTGTAQADLRVTDKEYFLPPGMVGKVIFKAREHMGLQVPESAVVYKGRDPHIRVVQEGIAKFLPITLGPTRAGQVEILKGLDAGSQYVVRASTYVGDGEEVDIHEPEAQKPKKTGE